MLMRCIFFDMQTRFCVMWWWYLFIYIYTKYILRVYIHILRVISQVEIQTSIIGSSKMWCVAPELRVRCTLRDVNECRCCCWCCVGCCDCNTKYNQIKIDDIKRFEVAASILMLADLYRVNARAKTHTQTHISWKCSTNIQAILLQIDFMHIKCIII